VPAGRVKRVQASPYADWAEAQQGLKAAATRLGAVIRSASRPDAPALGIWTVTDVAVHVLTAIQGVTALAEGAPGGFGLADISELAAFTTAAVRGEAGASLSEVADGIERGRFLELLEAAGGLDTTHEWMISGMHVPRSTMTCHLFSEVLVHGHDIAVANGVPWPIPRRHAAIVVDGFLLPLIGMLGRTVVDQEAARGLRACYEIHVRGGGRSWVRFDDGTVTVDTLAQRPVDCYLSVDPEAFLLVAWGRRSQWPAIARGQLTVWGRRPWLGPRLRSLLINP